MLVLDCFKGHQRVFGGTIKPSGDVYLVPRERRIGRSDLSHVVDFTAFRSGEFGSGTFAQPAGSVSAAKRSGKAPMTASNEIYTLEA